MTAHLKQLSIELREIRKTLAVLEAAYFQLAEVFEARGAPYLLTIPRASKLLGVGAQTLGWLIADRKIRRTKVGKRFMVARTELERFAQRTIGFELAPGLQRKLRRRPLSLDDLSSLEGRALQTRKAAALAAARRSAAAALDSSTERDLAAELARIPLSRPRLRARLLKEAASGQAPKHA